MDAVAREPQPPSAIGLGAPEAERRRPKRPARLPGAWLLAGVMCSLLSRRAGQASLGRPEVLLLFFFSSEFGLFFKT